ncbi:MAG: DUF481 domain-containing protein [Pseudobdellovibrionaceae bacterium]|nr:MAG: DUF481 domain-containing protein [Pseudobdellovibrionaceae bacterium]
MGAIVNIESLRMEPSAPVQAEALVSIDGKVGNSQKNAYSFSGQVRTDSGPFQNLGLIKFKYETSQTIKTADQLLAHYRWNYNIWPNSSIESYVQWERDVFKRLASRSLAGAGLRTALSESESFRLYLGAGAFYYEERYEVDSQNQIAEIEQRLRGNFYLSSKIDVAESVDFKTTLYYQPLFESLTNSKNPQDFRLLWQNYMEFLVNSHLSWVISYQLFHDSQPPAGVKTTDQEYGTSLKLSFR